MATASAPAEAPLEAPRYVFITKHFTFEYYSLTSFLDPHPGDPYRDRDSKEKRRMYAYSAGLDSMSSQLEMRGVASEQLPHDIRFSTHLSSWQREVAGLLDKVNVMQGEIEEIEKSIRTACWVEMRDWQ